MKKNAQKRKVFSDLMRGMNITQLDAYDRYRCTRLAAIIWELRHKHGIPVMSKRITIDDNDKQYAMYYLRLDDIDALYNDPDYLVGKIPTWKSTKVSQMTNFEKLKAEIANMTAEDFEEKYRISLHHIYFEDYCVFHTQEKCPHNRSCGDCRIAWLNAVAESEDKND